MDEEQLKVLLVNVGIHIGWAAWHDHQDWFEMDVYARASVEDIAWLSEQDGVLLDEAQKNVLVGGMMEGWRLCRDQRKPRLNA
jgi:hypothetical protein